MTHPASAPVVIIGGGIIGCSTLYHLAHKGVPAVLLERKQITSGTTWHAAGIVGQLRESAAQTELSKYTARLFQTLEEETGQATGYKQNGTINLALSDVRMEQIKRSHDHALRMGIKSHLLTPEETAERWPWVNYDGVQGSFHVPSNGQVNPLDVCLAMAKGARQKGAQIFEHTAATRILTKAGRVIGVETDKGVIATEKVLLAGGMWTARFAKAHGVTVPLHAAEHFYIVTEPVKDLPKDLPILNILEERTYWKEDAGKLLIGGFEARGKAWAKDGIPQTFEFDELPFDMDHAEPELQVMFERMPALADMGIQTFFNGPESFTPDGRPFIGPAPEMPGLFIAAGMNSNGILNSGGVGLTMSEWMTDGMPKRGMGSIMAARALPFQSNLAYNAERVTESIGLHYGLHWPGRQMETARGVRRVPLHEPLAKAGAKFAERMGWEVPMYFDTDTADWPNEPSIGYQAWSPCIAQEVKAVQNAAGLLDQSMYAKLLLAGPDAVTLLNHICGAQMDVVIGTSVYTQFLNKRGGMEADFTVTRLADSRFMIITGHPSQARDMAWIKANADPNWQVELIDMTSAYSLLTIHGPKSRAILQALSSDDLSNDAFPFGAAQDMDVAFARAWVIRRSFFGELGYELMIPSEFSAHVYEALMREGAPLGLRHVGMFAMNACRLEKGFRHFGHDIAEDDTPFETGLGFAVDLSKADFIGKAALLKQKETCKAAVPDRLVTIAVPELTLENGPYLSHDETIWKNGDMVGYVTSGGWGYRLQQMIGIATLHQSGGVTKAWIDEGGFTARIAGVDYPIHVQLAPLYDPQCEKMRS